MHTRQARYVRMTHVEKLLAAFFPACCMLNFAGKEIKLILIDRWLESHFLFVIPAH
jgi:hypothetical protein